MAALLDLLRLFAGASILTFAAWTDWRWRRAPNVLWLVLALVGFAALAADLALDPAGTLARWPYLAFVPVFCAFVYALWWLGLVAGGADAKALMALAVLAPFPLALGAALPLWQSPTPGAFVILGDALLVFLLIPLSLLVWNLARGDARFPHALLGVRVPAAGVRRGHHWPMETVGEDGRRTTRFFASRMDPSEVDATFERVQALGAERVWVTPKIPFLIPLLAGFVLAYFAGDLLYAALDALLPTR